MTVVLTGISSRTWEHPADRGALAAIRRLEGYDVLHDELLGARADADLRRGLLGRAVRADERQLSRVHGLFAEGARALDIGGLPDLFVEPRAAPYAVTLGVTSPVVAVSSGLVALLDDDELRFALAGQLGRAVSGHAPYRTLLERLRRLEGLLGAGARTVLAALGEWEHQGQLSGDRAALLGTQDPTVALSALMKLASGGRLDALDPPSFLAQTPAAEPTGDLVGLLLDGDADRPVARARALHDWIEAGDHARVVAGDYPRRSEDPDAHLGEEARLAGTAYAATFQRTRDAADQLMAVLGTGGTVRRWLDDAFRRR